MTTDPRAVKTVEECVAWARGFNETGQPHEHVKAIEAHLCRLSTLEAENKRLREALIDAKDTMTHATVFVNTREHIHPDGLTLWFECLSNIRSALSGEG